MFTNSILIYRADVTSGRIPPGVQPWPTVDRDSASAAACGLCFELFAFQIIAQEPRPSLIALRSWMERAKGEGIAAYQSLDSWLEPLAAARDGPFRTGSLVGSSAADAVRRLWVEGVRIADRAISIKSFLSKKP